MKRDKNLEHLTFVLIVIGSVTWLLAQDFLYLIPVMGVIGPLLALKAERDKETVEEIRRNIIEKLPHKFGLKSPEDDWKVQAFASEVTGKQQQVYVE